MNSNKNTGGTYTGLILETFSRQQTATTHENIKEVHNLILDDRRLKVYKTADAEGILEERVWYILHKELGMRKFCAKWVQHLLNSDHKLEYEASLKIPLHLDHRIFVFVESADSLIYSRLNNVH